MTLLERTENARAELFKRYDQINHLWEEVEKGICRFHIPREVRYEYSFDPRLGAQFIYCLGITKIKGKWRLCHGSYFCPDEEEQGPDWKPIIECSGEIRIEAVKHLSTFRNKIVEDAEKFIGEADNAIEILEDFLGRAKLTDLADLLAERAKLNGQTR